MQKDVEVQCSLLQDCLPVSSGQSDDDSDSEEDEESSSEEEEEQVESPYEDSEDEFDDV